MKCNPWFSPVILSTILASNEISPISSKIPTTTKRPVKKIRVAQSTSCKTFSTCVLVIIKRMAAPPNAIIDTSIPIVSLNYKKENYSS